MNSADRHKDRTQSITDRNKKRRVKLKILNPDSIVVKFSLTPQTIGSPLGCYQWWNFIWAQRLNFSFWSI